MQTMSDVCQGEKVSVLQTVDIIEKKTVAIRDDLFHNLELNHIMTQYQSFSELVSNALQLLIEKQKKDQYKKVYG